jgi:hypothetical protein
MGTKYIVLPVILALLISGQALAGFDVPNHVYSVAQIKRAKVEALAKNRALTFVFTDPETTCGLCKSASLDAFRKLRDSTIVILVESHAFGYVPHTVKAAMSSKRAGRYIPKTVVTDAEASRVLCVIPYSRHGRSRLFKEANRLIEEYRAQNRKKTVAQYSPLPDLLKKAKDKVKGKANGKAKGKAKGKANGKANGKAKDRAENKAVPVQPPPAELSLVIGLRWRGSLDPVPTEKLPAWFLSKDYHFETLESEAGSCRFRVKTRGVTREHFEAKLNGFLKFNYKATKHSGDGAELTWNLARQ